MGMRMCGGLGTYRLSGYMHYGECFIRSLKQQQEQQQKCVSAKRAV